MARLVLTTPGEDVDVGGDIEIFGTRAGGEVITLLRGSIQLDASFNAGGDTIALPQGTGAYSVRLVGSRVEISSGTLNVLIPVGTVGIEIDFDGVPVDLVFDAGTGRVLLGDQVVTAQSQPVDPDAAQGPTPVIQETGAANDDFATAQRIGRDDLAVSENPLLHDDSLRSATISGSLSANADRDFYAIELEAGELLLLDIDGAEPGLDTVIRLFGPDGQEITFGDDAPLDPGSLVHPNSPTATLDSFVSFRAATSGLYRFSVESWESGSSGDYDLHVSIGDPAPLEQILAEDIRNLWGGNRWNTANLTYGFPTLPSQYGGSSPDETGNNFEGFNATQRAAVTQILGQYAAVTTLSFALAADPATADLRYAMSDEPETAFAYYPSRSALGGDSWYNNSSGDYDNPVPGDYAWATLLHETGHAMGLKHGHEAPALSLTFDWLAYTVMSYRSYAGAPAAGDDAGYVNETWGFPTTLMMLDIAALQSIYGANYGHNGGDTVYHWNPSNGNFSVNGAVQIDPGANRVFMTLWDGGGEDTYDFSDYRNGVIADLRPGEWSRTSPVQLANLGGGMAPGNVANALMFGGDERSLIENAIGGGGADTFIANQVANEFTGGAGADRFSWQSLADSAVGEADIILDFENGVDVIDLSGIDIDPDMPGIQGFVFIGADSFSGEAGELRYQVEEDYLRLQWDTDGDSRAEFEILLANLASFDQSSLYG